MKQQIQVLRTIATATSWVGILAALKTIGQNPSGNLAKELSDGKTKKGARILLMVLACIAICAATYFAFIGGGYIAEYAGKVALIFGLLDLSIVALLYTDAVKGKFRYILVTFEIISLLYLGYAMGGYFGGGNAQTAAEKKLAEDYAAAKEHYISAATISHLMDKSIENASNIAQVESQRDGKGVVYEKAALIAGMKHDPVPDDDTLPQTPKFDNLAVANKWLQSERQSVNDRISKYDAVFGSIKTQAQSTDSSLKKALGTNLSEMQRNNLSALASSMEGVANSQAPRSTTGETVLRPEDLKADGFQGWVGYLIDCVTIFFVLMLAFQKEDERNLDAIKDQEMKAIMENALTDSEIHYDAEELTAISAQKLFEEFKRVANSDTLTKYLREKGNFTEYVNFSKEYPQIARGLEKSQWSLAEIKKELKKNPKFAEQAEYAISLTTADWKTLNESVNNPEDLFRLEPTLREEFLKAIKNIRSKGVFEPESLKKFMGQFLLVENPSNGFMDKLVTAATNLQSEEKIKALTVQFINAVSTKTLELICRSVEDDKQFTKLVKGWNANIEKSFAAVVNSSLANETDYDRFMRVVLDKGGIDAAKQVAKSYEETKAEIESGSLANKKMVLQPNFENIRAALNTGNENEFHKELGNAITTGSVTVSL